MRHAEASGIADSAGDRDVPGFLVAREWHAEGREVALATVVKTWGSSPRQPGSQLVVDETGRFVGSVSGGCVESDVLRAAAESLRGGEATLLDFGIESETAWSVGLPCGGRLRVLVQPVADTPTGVSLAALAAMSRYRECPVAAVTRLRDLAVGWATANDAGGLLADDDVLRKLALQHLAGDSTGAVTVDDDELFVHAVTPEPTLVIVGAVHVARPLASMALTAGLHVTIIDPRRGFAESANMQGLDVMHGWPDEVLPTLETRGGIAVATLTHEARLDDAALAWALQSDAFYIGALGSRRTHAKRLERLAEQGFSTSSLSRIRAPIGLPIGAATPSEIAVSIIAQVVAARRGAEQ